MQIFTPYVSFSVQDLLIVSTLFISIIPSLIALIHCAMRPFRDNTHKILWILVILIAPILGPLAYAIAGRKMAATE